MQPSKLDQLRIEREPQKESSAQRWPLVTAGAALAAAALLWIVFRPASAVEISVASVREFRESTSGNGTVLNASGYVTARRQATVSSEVTGKVVEVRIEEGMTVEQGQVLAKLDDANIRASYELAEAQLHSARSALKETRALLAEARANFDRTENLVRRRLASEAELDRARAQAEALAAQLEHKEADIVVAQKGLEVWAQQLEDTIIRAPFAGVVVAKNAQPGEMISPVSAGGGFTRTGIGTIVDMDSLEIEIDVNEAYINRVAPGQEVVATLDAYPQWKIPAHVIAIVPTADRQRATVEVRVGFDRLDPRMLPDMGVKVAFQETEAAPERARGWLVPAAAVRVREGREVVYVIKDGRAERREVSVSQRRGEDALLASGVAAGETVVVHASAELYDGVKVKEKAE